MERDSSNGAPGSLPELGFRADLVGRPQLHPVDLGMLIGRRRECSPHHLILMELQETREDSIKTAEPTDARNPPPETTEDKEW